MDYFGKVQAAADAVRARAGAVPRTAIVLGSGLGDFAGSLRDATSITYGELPNWPVSAVPGHEGRLVIGTAQGHRVDALAGRCHLYEGFDVRSVTFWTRGLGLLGIKGLILPHMAAGVLPHPLNHAEVMDTARRVRGQFIALLEGIIGRLS